MLEPLESRLAFSAYDLPLNYDPGIGRMAVTGRGTLVIEDDAAREQVLRLTVGAVADLPTRIRSNLREVDGTNIVSVRPFVGNGFNATWLPVDMANTDLVGELQVTVQAATCLLLQDVTAGVNILVPVDAFRRVRIELGSGSDRLVIERRVPRPIEVNAGPGADRVDSSSPGVVIRGGPGNDRLGGYAGYATLQGGGGDDRMFLASRGSSADGGSGWDVLTATAPNQLLTIPARIEAFFSTPTDD